MFVGWHVVVFKDTFYVAEPEAGLWGVQIPGKIYMDGVIVIGTIFAAQTRKGSST